MHLKDSELEEKTLKENVIFDGRIIQVREDDVILPNMQKAKREVAYHHGGVCVVPVTDGDEIIMVRQFRYPYKEIIYEIPAGKLEKGEDPYGAGMRELEEEAGVTADKLESLGKFYPTPGYCSEIIYMYLAENLSKSQQHLDEDEFLDVYRFKIKDAVRMIMDGEITDGKTQTAILKVAMKRGIRL